MVWGAVVSTVKLRLAGDRSVSGTELTAWTAKVWEPSGRSGVMV